MKDVGKFPLFYCHLVYLWPFDIFCGHFGIFFPFWYVVQRKIWQPWNEGAGLPGSQLVESNPGTRLRQSEMTTSHPKIEAAQHQVFVKNGADVIIAIIFGDFHTFSAKNGFFLKTNIFRIHIHSFLDKWL
jgi:hypothetical protein